jgi:hypothetical protein
LRIITRWIITENQNNNESIKNLEVVPIRYFGASTGAAAAIEAYSSSAVSNLYSDRIYAIVSRGARPDLASADALRGIKAATLFIVGEKDDKDNIFK